MNSLKNCIAKAGKLLSPREGTHLLQLAETIGDEGAVAAAISFREPDGATYTAMKMDEKGAWSSVTRTLVTKLPQSMSRSGMT